MAMGEFCLAQKISHQHSEHSMSRDSGEHSKYSCSKSVLKHINDIFCCGESHTHHDGIDDSIERLVKITIVIEDESKEDEFAELLNERHAEVSTYEVRNTV